MLHFLHTHLDRPLSEAERLAWIEHESGRDAPSWRRPLQLPLHCQTQLKTKSVAVVGGGFAGLMAARRLGQHGVKVTVFEARDQWGGRVLSNRKFSNGRITEEGAELIGSFHTTWLDLARYYGLAMISRMDPDLYEREGLNQKLTLDKPLSGVEIARLEKEMREKVLEPIAVQASAITNPFRPWADPKRAVLKQLDSMSVAVALQSLGVTPNSRLWKMIEFKLVNDEVAPLDKMNFLGLLCKVRAGQNMKFRSDPDARVDPKGARLARQMRYWTELEIFRCADGCQALATKMAEEIHSKYGADLLWSRAVTHIDLSQTKAPGAVLGFKKVVNQRYPARLADGPPLWKRYDYVILAIPPSVWYRVTFTPWDPKNKTEIGIMGMDPAVKFFSDVKERFWIKDGDAPYGGSSDIGQVWEGTDNQTRVDKNQGIVLSVFAGPILPGGRAPTPDKIMNGPNGLKQLYGGYAGNLNKTLFSNWPIVPFIETGYASPRLGEIFMIVQKLSQPFHGLLFFAGEHTRMDFFGYMEGALRSGLRSADQLVRQACGLLEEPMLASPSPPARIARAAPTRQKRAFELKLEIPIEEELEAEEMWEELAEDN